MASANKVILIGNLGANPDVRYMPNGDAVTNISVATTESWKDKASGEKKSITEWHRVIFYRRLAEIVGEYLKKGSSIYVEGRIRTRKWKDKEGQERYTTEIEATEMQMLGSRPEQVEPASASYGSAKPRTATATQPAAQADIDDDIPY